MHYKGAGPMNTDLMAGRVDAAPGLPFVVAPILKAGKAIPIASLTAGRSKFMPDLVPVSELGIPDYDYSSYSGYLAPARTPPAVVARWNAAFQFVAKSQDIIDRMARDSAEMVGSTPEALAKQLAAEYNRFRKIVAENGIKLEE